MPFRPYFDDFNSDPFIPKDPWDMIEAGEFNDVPLILGNNNDEGLFLAADYYRDPTLIEDLSRNWFQDLGPLFIATRCVTLIL